MHVAGAGINASGEGEGDAYDVDCGVTLRAIQSTIRARSEVDLISLQPVLPQGILARVAHSVDAQSSNLHVLWRFSIAVEQLQQLPPQTKPGALVRTPQRPTKM